MNLSKLREIVEERGAWRAVVHGVTRNQTWLRDSTTTYVCLTKRANRDIYEKWKKWKLLSCVQLFATPWIKQSMDFSRPEYWSEYPFPSPGDLPNPGIKLESPALQAFFSLPTELSWKPNRDVHRCFEKLNITIPYIPMHLFIIFIVHLCYILL